MKKVIFYLVLLVVAKKNFKAYLEAAMNKIYHVSSHL